MKTVIDVIEALPSYEDSVAFIERTLYRTFTYSYKELYYKILQFQSYLNGEKIKKGDRVILWAPNSFAWVVAFYAIVRQGAIVVPLDYHYDFTFVKGIKKETQAKAIITTEKKRDCLNFCDMDEHETKVIDAAVLEESDTLEIVYTSGTTGKPKGVVLKHKNIMSNLKSFHEHYPLQNEIILCPLPLTHVYAQIGGLLYSLASSSTLIVTESLFPTKLVHIMKQLKVSVLLSIPKLLEVLVSVMPPMNKMKKYGFKHVFVGGAAFPETLETKWAKKGYIVLQGYGLTETSPVVAASLHNEVRPGSAGKILSCNQVKIVDGEVWVKGDNVFSEYYKDRKRTKQVFHNDWFKTGDLGELKDGWLYIKGRKDELIVTAEGKNVSPEEIETIIKKSPGVQDACVFSLNNTIHASILGTITDPDKATIQNKLLSWQHIKVFHGWPKADFPRTVTRKVKRKEVAEYHQQHKKEITYHEDPVIALAEKIKGKKVDPKKTLKQEGFTSLDRVQLASFVEQTMGYPVLSIPDSTIIKDLRQVVTKQKSFKQRKFMFHPIYHFFRHLFLEAVIFPIAWIFWRIKKQKSADLTHLPKGPYIVIANHESHLDFPFLMAYAPYSIRKKIAAATRAEYFWDKEGFRHSFWKLVTYNVTSLIGTSFMFPQRNGFQQAFQFMGGLLDNNWSIMIFPEGERTPNHFTPFKHGIGYLVKVLRVPVIPCAVKGTGELLGVNDAYPHFFGKATVIFGDPLTFSQYADVADITKECEKAVQGLYKKLK